MGSWMETYRGAVKAWEVDALEHFTVAYYFHRLGDATLNLMSQVGLGPHSMRTKRRTMATISIVARFESELRAGDVLHIDSGVLETTDRGARFGHRLYDSATGAVTAWFRQDLRYMDLEARRGLTLPEETRASLERFRVTWDGPTPDRLPTPPDEASATTTAYDTVKPWEIDVLGHLSVQFYANRFADASAQLLARIGLHPAHLRESRTGLSTFEVQTRFRRELNAGDQVQVRSSLVHSGSTSLRILSHLYNAQSGELSAELWQSGVYLDLDTRRPRRLPAAVRTQALALEAAPTPASGRAENEN